MNKRLLLALALSAMVIGLTQYFFPQPKLAPKPVATSTAGAPSSSPGATISAPTAGPAVTGGQGTPDSAVAASQPAEITALTSTRSTVRLSSLGAAPTSVELHGYKKLVRGGAKGDVVELVRPGESLLSYALVLKQPTGNQVIDLSRVPFTTKKLDEQTVEFSGNAGASAIAITYRFQPDSFLVRVGGTVSGITVPAFLRITLPSGLQNAEADTAEEQSHLAVAMKAVKGDASSIDFRKLDPGEKELREGPFTWVVSKSKYFLTGLLTADGDAPFAEVAVRGGDRTGKAATRVDATVLQGLTNGTFRFELYAGPQEWRRLVSLGREFENSNPYGGWLQGLVQPLATFVMKSLLWMHDSLKLNYGWVLVIFGVAIRLIMWPFNQGAMRSQMKMQVLQPELQAVQEKYRDDPQRMQQETMKVYRDHGMSPFSSLAGCLPMLLPMPVFITLFYVFQNTIEFRGVPFLYLTDISQADPTFILPLLMAATAFLLSWIGMRGLPPNPQTKMMSYIFPVMMFVFFYSSAAGLNLYYMVQNLAGVPQQWLIARERTKTKDKPVVFEKGAPARSRKA
jgi:YidC/Oxa1 family membrane protein insertase